MATEILQYSHYYKVTHVMKHLSVNNLSCKRGKVISSLLLIEIMRGFVSNMFLKL